jgi:hypothetical protein
MWGQFAGILSNVWRIITQGLIPAFIQVAHLMGPFLFAGLVYLNQIFSVLGHHTWLVKGFFALLALEMGILATRTLFLLPIQIAQLGVMIGYKAILAILNALGIIRIATVDAETGAEIANTVAKEKNVVMSTMLSRALKLNVLWTNLSTKAMRLWMAVSKGYVIAAGGQFVKLTRLEKGIMAARRAFIAFSVAVRARAAALAASMMLAMGPAGWIILGVTALVAALVVLYFKWGAFHDLVNRTWAWIKGHGKDIALALGVAFAPIFGAYIAIKHIRDILNGIKGVWNFIFGGGGGNNRINPAFGRSFGGAALSPVTAGGYSSPQMISPIGTAVSKMGKADQSWQHNISGGVTVHAQSDLYLDGKKVAESVSQHRLDSRARR